MSNHITIELCAEDRARLDRLIEALEKKSCDLCVNQALQWQEQILRAKDTAEKKEPDEIQQKLAETLAKANEPVEAPKNTTEEAETSTQTTTPPEEEKPTGEEPTTPPTDERPVGRAELRAKVIELSAKGLKDQAKDIVRAYAQTVTAIPEDKVTECYMRLANLEL